MTAPDYVEIKLNDSLNDQHEDDHLLDKEAHTALLNTEDKYNNAVYDNTPTTHSHSLALQALPSLIISVIGLVFAGELMDDFQHLEVFLETTELFILLPILLNLKGNLEMNLAARLSTSSNLGELDYGPTRRSLIFGNLCLLQVQSLVAGATAGLSSFALGLLTKPGSSTSYYEMIFMTSSAMVAASISSAALGVFMCVLIVICRRFNIDPDNIACPLASSIGDIVTLVILAAITSFIHENMESLFSTFLFICMTLLIPVFGSIVWNISSVKHLLFSGWTPLILAMVISSLAGIILEAYVEQYKGVALLTPVLIGLAGNLGSIYASRMSTCLHADMKEEYKAVEYILLGMNVPVQLVFMFILWVFDMGKLNYTIWFFLAYFLVTMISTWICLKIAKYMTHYFWSLGYDPDNYVIPYLTASIDVIGTILLVGTFIVLTNTGGADMSIPPITNSTIS
ncbi:hypothetical protein BDB01DRAFT_501420 [Pilobolus umbonatus]|nr:hypothetical protein BDB01DRAFT_501420 [Pilobolus umbonatus]